MWICLNNAFLSIVQPRAIDVPKSVKDKDVLMVRARRVADLKRTFPGKPVFKWRGRDYPCRVFVSRDEAATAVGKAVTAINYPNFKDSVTEGDRHDAYMAVWNVMNRFQTGGFSRKRPPARLYDSFDDERDFSWGKGQRKPPFRDRMIAASKGEPEQPDAPCTTPGCSDMNPCLDCLIWNSPEAPPQGTAAEVDAIVDYEIEQLGREPDRYGPFDEEEDADAQSHLRAPPR